MTPQQLKNSILQRAIEGRLVEQRPEEGTAKDLLKEIRAEKDRLIAEGKIKKSKPLPPITEDEKPFEIPEGWEWVRLGDIGILQTGTTPPREHPEYFGDNIPFITPGDISACIINYDNQGLSQQGSEYGRIVETNSILQVCIGGTIGKAAICKKPVTFNQQINSITPYAVNAKYLFHVVVSSYFYKLVREKATGTATPIINKSTWSSLPIPLPPLSEQRRIVSKIEELLPLLDKYDKAYTKLTDYNARFPEAMKKSILQYAIQGKLVEQRPEEGTAKDLLKEIRAEKERLIEEGKIKKSKPLPPITEEEKPFEIPEGWEWVRLSDVIDVRDGTHDTPAYQPNGIPLVTSKNISSGKLDFENVKYISPKDADRINERSKVEKNDILFAMIGSIGNPVLVDTEIEFCIKNVALFKNYTSNSMCMRYVYWLMNYFQHTLRSNASGAVQSFVSLKVFRECLIPLPPLSEQHRIVSKIEELLPLCEKLVKSDA
ncbi:MAG TPA: restriction endonuclease [Selenomonas sp.]|nr:restriction endonuclease [Selenomonas sp.]